MVQLFWSVWHKVKIVTCSPFSSLMSLRFRSVKRWSMDLGQFHQPNFKSQLYQKSDFLGKNLFKRKRASFLAELSWKIGRIRTWTLVEWREDWKCSTEQDQQPVSSNRTNFRRWNFRTSEKGQNILSNSFITNSMGRSTLVHFNRDIVLTVKVFEVNSHFGPKKWKKNVVRCSFKFVITMIIITEFVSLSACGVSYLTLSKSLT